MGTVGTGSECEQSDCEQGYDGSGSGNDYVMLVTLSRSLDASVVGGFKGWWLVIVARGWWLVARRRLLVAGG